MKSIITFLLSFLFFSCYALPGDSTLKTTLVCYNIDGIGHYLVTHCVPGSNVEFYSEKWGGKHLLTTVADSTGSVTVTGDSTFRPAFALNRYTANASGKIGNGIVGFRTDTEFRIQSLSIARNNNNIEATWLGQACNRSLLNFEVVKTQNDISTVIANYRSSNIEQYYSYVGAYDADASYSLRVVHATAGVLYQFAVSTGENAARIQVYPTAASHSVNIIVPKTIEAKAYHIVDVQGKVVNSGVLHTGKNTVAINDLVPGNYIVTIPGSAPVKIVKE